MDGNSFIYTSVEWDTKQTLATISVPNSMDTDLQLLFHNYQASWIS